MPDEPEVQESPPTDPAPESNAPPPPRPRASEQINQKLDAILDRLSGHTDSASESTENDDARPEVSFEADETQLPATPTDNATAGNEAADDAGNGEGSSNVTTGIRTRRGGFPGRKRATI